MPTSGAGSRCDFHPVRASRTRLTAAAALLVLLAAPAQASEELVLIPDIPLLATMIALFVVLIFPVNALIFKPIFSALDERANRISGARQRAQHVQAEADAVLQRYEDAIREARSEAEGTRKSQLAEARSEQAAIAAEAKADAERRIEQTRSELGVALVDARESLRASSRELANIAASQILGRPIQ